MAVQISMFDDIPDVDMPATGRPAVIYQEENRKNGHLLITTGPPRTGQDWLFLNSGGKTIRCCLPGWDTGVDLTAEQLRVLGRYCLDIADRIETR
jgi:hypothetical protein